MTTPLPDGSRGPADGPLLSSPHRLRLAVFSPNMAGGASLTTAPEAPAVTWPETLAIVQAAEAAGLDAVVPVARWRGMGDPARPAGHRSFEAFTWAAGVAAVTSRIQVFATVHTAVVHPVVAAKQIATVDHISGGRFAVNVVAGWNTDEFRMLGLTQAEHADRYAAAREWMHALDRVFASSGEIDLEGPVFPGGAVVSEPKPIQAPRPLVMNAGSSPPGRAFAAEFADVSFALLPGVEGMAETVAGLKTAAAEHGRELLVFAAGHVVCRDSEAAAHAELARQVSEVGDAAAAANALRLLIPNSQSADFDTEGMSAAAIAGFFAIPFVGTPEQVVAKMRAVSDAGLDGLALSWLDYPAGITQYTDVLHPLLVEAGLRQA